MIVVGNLSVGGTGKTPLVCWLARQLQALGRRPGVVTRGYGGRVRGPARVEAGSDPAQVGDEAVLIARRSGVPVAVGRSRPAAARLLTAAGCDVVVSDDGLQHYALARDCELVVIDGERGFGNGWLLPAGPLREPPARLAGVDAIILSGAARAEFAGAPVMHLDPGPACSLHGLGERRLESFAGLEVHALAGIGHPERFFGMLRARGIRVLAHPQADHARLVRADIDFGDRRPVLMTEKDAVKCRSMADERHWFVPVEARFEESAAETLLTTVRACLTRADGRRESERG